MPGMDRKGPEGKGPRTGRGLGRCNEKENSEIANEEVEGERSPGRGFGFGRGRRGGLSRGMGRGPGRGRRNYPESEGE